MATLFGDFNLPLWFNDERVSRWKNHVMVPMVVCLCVLAAVRTLKEMKILVLVMCLSMAVLIRQQYNNARYHSFDAYDDSQRAEGYENGLGSNELGALEVQFCLFVLGLRALERRRLWRWIYLALGGMTAYCVMASFSRGAYVAFIVGWAFLGIVKERTMGVSLVLFLLTWQVIVPNAVRERIFMTYDKSTGGLESSAASRVSMWEDALDAFQQEPVFGTGYDTYRFLSRIGWHDCHNLYVKLIFELGVVGLVGFLVLLWKLYHLGYRLFRTANEPFLASIGLGLAGWVVCAAVANCFGDRWNYVQITGYMWAFAGCVVRGLAMTGEKAEAVDTEVGELAHA
jgi:O-antigen ligase